LWAGVFFRCKRVSGQIAGR